MDAVFIFRKGLFFLFKKEKIVSFEDKLLLNNSRMKNLNGFLKLSIIEGTLAMICGMFFAASVLGIGTEKFVALGSACFFVPLGINFIAQDIIFEKRKRKKEALLPDLLLEASVFCDENSLINTIKKITEQDFALLKNDFERALNEINKGASIETALNRMKKLNKSSAINRTVDLLLQSYKSGNRMSKSFKETAEDLLEAEAIIKERQAVMLVTKYTLILSAGIIVPAILGLIIGLVSGMNFGGMGELSLGLSINERNELFSSAISGATIYLLEYAGLASFFLAAQEGNKKQFWVYCLILIPLAFAAFSFAKML